ncbi:Aureobasidin resistance protein Aur1 [Podila epigama]|nr:Aureobasidin resistance protein Aur1 [Podila epigama]
MPPLSRVYRSVQKLNRASRMVIATAIHSLQHHTYTLYDLQYVFLLGIFTFCYFIIAKPFWFKFPIVLATIALLFPRRTRLFMLPFLAIAAWLILFYSCRFIPAEWRPHIFTSVLPALENILYGGNISGLLAVSTSPFKDMLAWLPYGVLHYVLPVITAVLIVFFAPPGTLPVYARTFGYMNLAGVITQIVFPCAPPYLGSASMSSFQIDEPWRGRGFSPLDARYEARYGPIHPAEYSMPGDPGGLARVDDILGTDMYNSTFTANPLVFGAFPSLHSAIAWQLAFFLVFTFGPRAIPFAMTYVFWIWWATMYLNHHYVVDLVGGGVYAVVAFWLGSYFLPTLFHSTVKENERRRRQKQERVTGKMSMAVVEDVEDLGDAMGRQEKQLLFDAEDNGEYYLDQKDEERKIREEEEDDVFDDDATGISSQGSTSNNSSSTCLSQDERTNDKRAEDVKYFSDTIDAFTPFDFADAHTVEPPVIVQMTLSDQSPEASSPTEINSGHQWRQSARRGVATGGRQRQSWGGWQGYEAWIDVLATVTSPKHSPKTSPANSPRSSTTF